MAGTAGSRELWDGIKKIRVKRSGKVEMRVQKVIWVAGKDGMDNNFLTAVGISGKGTWLVFVHSFVKKSDISSIQLPSFSPMQVYFNLFSVLLFNKSFELM